ncbi:virulence factor TspB C-terminal domain-related protein [Variovorax sp. LT1R16]|uniref:virulence factor TspB C-terminal domain-related protein n=1 Tax=Variovorax sp. LT1R16 TaxID=3443728 RepID=UPI003F4684CE
MTVAKNVLNRIHVQRLLLAAALLGFSLSVTAAKLPAWGSVPYGQSGKTTSFGLGNQSGSITPPPGWQAAGNYGIPKAPVQGTSFALGADGKVFIPNKAGYYDGVMYPYRVGGDLKLGDLAAAAAGFLGGPLGVACMLACPLALDWLDKAGARIAPDGKGLQRQDPDIKKSNGKEYRWYTNGSRVGQWTLDPLQACRGYVADQNANAQFGFTYADPRIGPLDGHGDSYCFYRAIAPGTSGFETGSDLQERQSESCPAGWYIRPGGTCTPVADDAWIPASMDDIAPYMAQKAPDPGVVGELLRQGADIPLPSPLTVTGPTVIPGKENTTTNPDGSRTVEKTTYNFQTSGNTITNISNVTNTTTYNTDNSVRNTTTKTETPAEEEAEKDPEDPCKKNPERVDCMETDTPEAEIPKTTKNITFEAEDVLGGGACPANVTTSFQTLGGQSATIIDWQTFCGHALPLRALVMGLAAIMAFFIIMPGGVRE